MWIIIAYDQSPVHVTCLLSSPLALLHTCCSLSHQVLATSQQGPFSSLFVQMVKVRPRAVTKPVSVRPALMGGPQLLSAAAQPSPSLLEPGRCGCFASGQVPLLATLVSAKGVLRGHLGDCGSEEVLPSQPPFPLWIGLGRELPTPWGLLLCLQGSWTPSLLHARGSSGCSGWRQRPVPGLGLAL